MSLETSLKDAGAGLTSQRAIERKKNAEMLKDFLTRNAAPSLLTENTLNQKGYTWNDLFNDINGYISKELEKFETSKTFENTTAPLCTSLLHLCIAGSNKGKAYIKCDKITEACLYILRDNRLTRALGDAYANLLYKYILPYDYYLGYIKPSTWESLLDVCISLCQTNISKLDDLTKLKLVLLVIKNGKNNCQFVIPLRDSLSKLKRCFLKMTNDKKVQDVEIEIMILLLEALSTESRLTMCKFTESVLTSIFKFYDQNMDHKKKSSLFKLLQLTVMLHHPQGRLKNEEGSLAYDWDIWNKHLSNILEIICSEVNYLQRCRNQNDIILSKQCTYFFNLAALVYFQIFNIPLYTNEVGCPSKRLRVTFNKNKIFTDIINEFRQNHLPWLGIIHAYIKHYNHTITTSEYLSLISIIELHIINNTNLNWDIIEDMACVIIKNMMHDERKNEYYALILLWNSCVRNSTSLAATHTALHTIMQVLLKLNILQYQNVQSLFKLYFENAMPVTDSSINTLRHIFRKFFNKCSSISDRIKYFTWLVQGQVMFITVTNIKDFILQIISNENVDLKENQNLNSEGDIICDTLFNSIEQCILFSEFEIEILKLHPNQEEKYDNIDDNMIILNNDVDTHVQEYLNTKLYEYMEKLKKRDNEFKEFIKFTRIVLAYIDMKLKNNFLKHSHIKNTHLYHSLQETLKLIYTTLTKKIADSIHISEKIGLLQSVQDMLLVEYDPLLITEVRLYIEEDFFHSINNVLSNDVSNDDEVFYVDEAVEMNHNDLKRNCICLLAVYCRKITKYREEILELILDSKMYNFNSIRDIECAFQCINLLNNPEVQEPPLENVFSLMQSMCKVVYRNSKACHGILNILFQMLDRIWSQDNNMKQNCCIMVKSYLQRCEALYYPPNVAALVYKCIAKIISLSHKQKHEVDNTFSETLTQKMKGNSHCLRLYCCYLLNHIIIDSSDYNRESYLTGLMDLFLVNISEKKEEIIKDESVNRTLTVLHFFSALAQAKNFLLHDILTTILQVQKEKSLDEHLVKKVLNKITNATVMKDIDVYLNDHALAIFHFCFINKYKLNDLPIYLFGFDNFKSFLEKHLKWLIPADILWSEKGDILDSDTLQETKRVTNMSEGNIMEICFCNMIVLCLPFIVTEKYDIDHTQSSKHNVYIQTKRNACKVFQSMRQILETEKWSSLFVENIGELLLLTATHLSDHREAEQQFQTKIFRQPDVFRYPQIVFSAILKYFGELIDGNIMNYLCENQPLAIFKIMFKLWEIVLREKIFEYKVTSLHTSITFVHNIPLGYSSDNFVCNFTCNSITNAIVTSHKKEDIKLYTKALRMILNKFLPEKIDILKKFVTRLLSILIIKKGEGYNTECAELINYLTVDMKDYFRDSEDIVDFINTMSEDITERVNGLTKNEFSEKLKNYWLSLAYPSHETLLNLQHFLKINKEHLNDLSLNMNFKGFSEDCKTSIIHQVISSLNNVLKSASDNKTIIETCNCLAEIGIYDLKTLVTVPSPDTDKIIHIKPNQYFTIVVLESLLEVLFDDSPNVTNKVLKTLNSVLKYRDGKDALDLGGIEKGVLNALSLSSCNTSARFNVVDEKFDSYSGLDYWIPNETETHCEWMKRITSALLTIFVSTTNYISALHEVCVVKPNVCRKILPSLMGLLIHCSNENHLQVISEQLNQFFKYIWDKSFHDTISNSDDSLINHDHKTIIEDVLNIVNFIRLQGSHYVTNYNRHLETLNFLKLEYDKVAWAATLTGQNLVAVYYGELWSVTQNDGIPPSSPESTTNLNNGENIQRIFRKCFVSIGEMDALDGCGTAHLTREDEKRKHLINTGQFIDALLLHDIALSCENQTNHKLQYGVVRSLHKSGMYHLALQYIKSVPESDELNDVKYDCLSSLGDWNVFVDTRNLEEKFQQPNANLHSIIKVFRYACLKDCLNLQSTHDFKNKLVLPLYRAKLAISRLCKKLNMENCQNVYKIMANLHLFKDIEEYFSVRCDKLPLHNLLSQWQVEKLPAYNDFKYLEPLISQRSLILDHAAKLYTDSMQEILSLQLQYAEIGLSNQRVQMSQRILATVKKLKPSEEVALVEAQISWAEGHRDIARSLLRGIISNSSSNIKLVAITLRQYGIWMAESKYDNARNIINKYLKKSLEVLNKSDHIETRLKVYYDIAKFADTEYKQVVSYMNSSIFENKLKCMENMKDTASSLRSTQQTLTKDGRKALITHDRFSALDEAEIANTKAEKERFLQLAMRYYLFSLKQCEENNLSMFRVISLWLDNPCIKFDDEDSGTFENLLHTIPSRKFITVLPQLAPRLSNENSAFAVNLKRIIKKCAIEHPHHTLPILFSLKNSDKDKRKLNTNESVSTRVQQVRTLEPRVIAAESLVKELARENDSLAVIVSQMEQLCDAVISLANYIPKTKETKQKIPTSEPFYKLKNLDAIPLPTVTTPVEIDCRYLYLQYLVSFENYFELVGGINCPKKITCKISDGSKKVLLIKGEDDLRQDAVMQQVFNIVNTLLEKNPVTSRNKLLIRTYKVVPTSRLSGSLEWCEGTIPLGMYLAGGSNGAHARYRPNDISCNVARTKLNNCHAARKPIIEKLAVFNSILEGLKPVFHYFFTEHYFDPVTWYERRLAYTKSVATSSMVGYIMGLGDRHVQNILIDKKTAEVIHIDFGIAFDQGKALPTPETVPFRLTQDMIAGFGSCGVEGIFRNCCEKTMHLLRNNQETLLTILEVLLCDPLYSWTITTSSTQQNVTATRDPTSSNAGLAERALLTVNSKLSGTEGGVVGGVAVPGQVARLLNSATDPSNLCRLYPGWQPYL